MSLAQSVNLQVNGARQSVDADPAMPLLWVLRETLGLTGTKFGCGGGFCGACTVHLDGAPIRSCMVPVSAAQNRAITTIEGLSHDGKHPLQLAWLREQVPQCGYCQSGMLMAAAALLASKPAPTREDIAAAITNLCRCGTYSRIVRAIQYAAGMHE